MNYIVFDLEFNQDFSPGKQDCTLRPCFEIIQIGAVKLDEQFDPVDIFDRYVKPTIYPEVNPFVSELTGITTDKLSSEETFPEVYQAFTEFAENNDSVSCIWGMADLKELFKNVKHHELDENSIPKQYINLQTYAASYFRLPPKKLPKLKTTVERLKIPEPYPFHNALHDAYYTAQIFRNIYDESIPTDIYDPDSIPARRPPFRPQKQKADFSLLTRQFEKMFGRKLTEEEQSMIILAYKMGKTGQFLN